MFEIRFSMSQQQMRKYDPKQTFESTYFRGFKLSQEGLIGLNPVLERLMNEIMKIEREQVIEASV